jgi:cytochrome b pre-mRNA-processing protein 3
LRQVGVGDLVVGKKVRKMAEAYLGRATSYTAALAQGEEALATALQRNVYASDAAADATRLAQWTLTAKKLLDSQDLEQFMQGKAHFE